jgi:probable rRNA maturation factor
VSERTRSRETVKRPGALDGGAIALSLRARRLPCGRVRLAEMMESAARNAARRGGSRLESLSIVVVGDHTMRRLNREFHATDDTTDVLAFPFREGRRIDAEIVVCAPFARREAQRRGLPWLTELVLYVVHGVLHLTGEDDATPHGARRMRRLERAILGRMRAPLPSSHLDELKHVDPDAE